MSLCFAANQAVRGAFHSGLRILTPPLTSYSRLHVSSVFLGQASPVFKAMLGPKFREGQALAGDSRIDIPLPEDDPRAMESICNVLHFRSVQVPQKLDIDGLVQVTQHSDKYDVSIVMRTFIHAWVEKRLLGLDDHRNEAEQLIELLAVGLYLGLDEQVHKLGKLLIRTSY